MTKCMIWRHLYIDREFLLGSWVRDNLFFRFSLLQDIFCRAGPSCNFLRLLLLLSWTDLFLCCSNHSLARENSCCCLPTCSIRNSHLFHLILGTYGLHSTSFVQLSSADVSISTSIPHTEIHSIYLSHTICHWNKHTLSHEHSIVAGFSAKSWIVSRNKYKKIHKQNNQAFFDWENVLASQ